MRSQIIDTIFSISGQEDAFEQLEQLYSNITKEELAQEIVQVGIMPEVFDHDSSEEKLWSKFSDIILSNCLNHLGLKSQVIRTRGNSADVYSIGEGYTLVSDAKCFRLSRTAKNQKDFKIKALDDWRRQDTFALLVAPLYQYPADRSQIYPQAITRNVTLLSYTHLRFLLENGQNLSLQPIWEIGRVLNTKYSTAEKQTGIAYWEAVDTTMSEICGLKISDLKHYKQTEIDKTRELGQEGITYWESKIAEFNKLTREEAIKMLIRSQKIDQKIQTIHRVISRKYVI
jgi:type II restriction enzyme